MRYLFPLFLLVPIIEITVLLKASGVIGVPWTILLVITTAVIGASLVKSQGFSVLNSVQTKMAQGQVPAMEVAEGAAILVAGALLLTPGFVTDAFGFLCLMPPVRQIAIQRFLKNRAIKMSSHMGSGFSQSTNSPRNNPQANSGNVIEGEYSEKQD